LCGWGNRCRRGFRHCLVAKPPPATADRGFNRLLYRRDLPFSAEQILGISVPAERLRPPAHAIPHGRPDQLVDDGHRRPFLSVNPYVQRFDRQALRGSSGDFGRIRPNAVFCISEAKQISNVSVPLHFQVLRKVLSNPWPNLKVERDAYHFTPRSSGTIRRRV